MTLTCLRIHKTRIISKNRPSFISLMHQPFFTEKNANTPASWKHESEIKETSNYTSLKCWRKCNWFANYKRCDVYTVLKPVRKWLMYCMNIIQPINSITWSALGQVHNSVANKTSRLCTHVSRTTVNCINHWHDDDESENCSTCLPRIYAHTWVWFGFAFHKNQMHS